jgi:NAD(P)-dependent dehydrogenase (short-subunit alcohol dehydrogenase family)
LTDPNSIDSFIEETNDFLGEEPLHGLVNNAGWSPKSPMEERLGCLNGDLDAWRTVFELNFFAPLRLARGFASALTRGKGAIVNITSIAGHAIHPFAGSAYGTSKAALTSLTRELANEFADLGVRVNSVAPGEIETAMLSAQTEVLIPRIPLHRLGKPKDVASTIYFLCSDDSEYITGTEIFVTGGQHML